MAKDETIFCMCNGCHGDRDIKIEQFDKGTVLCDECIEKKKAK